jgi:hypothetical protein
VKPSGSRAIPGQHGVPRPAIGEGTRELVLADCAEGMTYAQIAQRRGISRSQAARIAASTIHGDPDLLTPGRAAAVTGYTARQLHHAAKTGVLRTVRVSASGHHRYSHYEIAHLAFTPHEPANRTQAQDLAAGLETWYGGGTLLPAPVLARVNHMSLPTITLTFQILAARGSAVLTAEGFRRT